jgi:hypothetical protein
MQTQQAASSSQQNLPDKQAPTAQHCCCVAHRETAQCSATLRQSNQPSAHPRTNNPAGESPRDAHSIAALVAKLDGIKHANSM